MINKRESELNLILFHICLVSNNLIFINSRNNSQTIFLKMYLAYGINETDSADLPIHTGCLPVFTSIIVFKSYDYEDWAECYKSKPGTGCHRNALVILSQKWTFCHLPCRFVLFSGIGPGFAIPLCGSDKELRE